MQQQEDVGTQYRSIILTLNPQQQAAALRSRDAYQQVGGTWGPPLGAPEPPLGDSRTSLGGIGTPLREHRLPSPVSGVGQSPAMAMPCYGAVGWRDLSQCSQLVPTVGLCQELSQQHQGDITTTIEPAGDFYYAEDHHQQYLHKVPGGYCGLKGTGVSCPVVP